MTHDEYCINVCKSKCCYLKEGPCPNLTKEFKCGIYSQWKNNTCNYSPGEGYATAGIEFLISNKLLKPEILDQCCYAKPELLYG